ncbi:MAG: NAD(P)/FAD-dependent oxidoreductase [Pseudomonadota bacterium]
MSAVADDKPIVVLGGGLTGLLLALYIARRGLPVEVYDRGPDPRRSTPGGGRSINLALAERGRLALQRVGLLADVMPLTVPMQGREIHDADGGRQLQAYGQFAGEQIYSIGRHDLTVALARACAATDVRLHFNQRCVGVDAAARSATFEAPDKTQHHCLAQTLIAADGAGSIVRRTLNDTAGFAADESLLDHGYKELSIPATAYGWYRANPNALHIWPRGGHMLIALPNLGGDFTATLFLANDGDPSFATLNSEPAIEHFFAKHYADAGTLMPKLRQDFMTNPTGIMGTVRCRRWHHAGDVLLIGDAAHAIVPFHGQGMNAAFEDCRVFDELLDEIGPQWPALYERFETARRGNANAIADMALENYTEMRDSVRDPLFFVRKALAFELEQRAPEHFIPRYSMVMFHPEIAYADAQQRGATQAELLARHTAGAASIEDVDIEQALAEVKERLAPMRS